MAKRIANQLIKLTTIGTIEEQCAPSTAAELAKFIINYIGLPVGNFENQIVYGSDVPTADQRGALWFRKDTNQNPMGIFYWNGNANEWLPYPQILPDAIQGNERKYFRFDITRNLEDMPIGFELDPDPLVKVFQKKTSDGKLKYAWIKLAGSKF